ncbi:MAG: DUF2059 domain-containing protein [Pseudomonadota bacterium]|nr:DUF2059 domain-containing protein [Pseudomonadota bacterium]
MSRAIIGTLLYVLLTASVPAQDDAQHLAREIMDRSGLDSQIEQIPLHIQAGLEQSQAQEQPLPPQEFERLSRIMAGAYDPKAIKATVLEHLERLSAEDLQAVLDWLNTPLGRKIVALEEATSAPEARDALPGVWQRFLTGEIPAERVDRIQRLIKAVNAIDLTVDLLENMQLAMASALSAYSQPGATLPLDELKKQIEGNRLVIRNMVAQEILVSSLHTYEALDNAGLDQYLDFAVSPPGKSYHDAVFAAFSDALAQAARRMADTLGRELQKERVEGGAV